MLSLSVSNSCENYPMVTLLNPGWLNNNPLVMLCPQDEAVLGKTFFQLLLSMFHLICWLSMSFIFLNRQYPSITHSLNCNCNVNISRRIWVIILLYPVSISNRYGEELWEYLRHNIKNTQLVNNFFYLREEKVTADFISSAGKTNWVYIQGCKWMQETSI